VTCRSAAGSVKKGRIKSSPALCLHCGGTGKIQPGNISSRPNCRRINSAWTMTG